MTWQEAAVSSELFPRGRPFWGWPRIPWRCGLSRGSRRGSKASPERAPWRDAAVRRGNEGLGADPGSHEVRVQVCVLYVCMCVYEKICMGKGEPQQGSLGSLRMAPDSRRSPARLPDTEGCCPPATRSTAIRDSAAAPAGPGSVNWRRCPVPRSPGLGWAARGSWHPSCSVPGP